MRRGSKPGERRGGRQKGTPNKATAEVKVLAQKYAPAAIEELGRLSTEAESEAARVAASKEILDRAYGKPMQPVAGNIAMRDARKVDEVSDAELEQIIIEARATNCIGGRL
jgi:hypothetical protein